MSSSRSHPSPSAGPVADAAPAELAGGAGALLEDVVEHRRGGWLGGGSWCRDGGAESPPSSCAVTSSRSASRATTAGVARSGSKGRTGLARCSRVTSVSAVVQSPSSRHAGCPLGGGRGDDWREAGGGEITLADEPVPARIFRSRWTLRCYPPSELVPPSHVANRRPTMQLSNRAGDGTGRGPCRYAERSPERSPNAPIPLVKSSRGPQRNRNVQGAAAAVVASSETLEDQLDRHSWRNGSPGGQSSHQWRRPESVATRRRREGVTRHSYPNRRCPPAAAVLQIELS